MGLIQSCCKEDHRIVGPGYIGAYDQVFNDQYKIETVNGPFLIHVSLAVQTSMLMDNFDIIQKSYAMTCQDTYKNQIHPSTVKLTCNKDFTFDNLTISAGDNFIDSIGLEISMEKEMGIIDIQFTQAFIDLVEFSKDTHQFTIELQTTDGLKIKNSIDLYINL
jgi:hypothetical protein